jgi:hypothetical protein
VLGTNGKSIRRGSENCADGPSRSNGGLTVLRVGIACLLLTFGISNALAETPVERGKYLVNALMACGSCHTPQDVNGAPIAEKALSGGLKFTLPAFVGTAPNITPDPDTGIGTWSDAEIKHAPDARHSAGSWATRRGAVGSRHAGRLL